MVWWHRELMEPFDNIIDIRNIKKGKIFNSVVIKITEIEYQDKNRMRSIWKRRGDLSSFCNFPSVSFSFWWINTNWWTTVAKASVILFIFFFGPLFFPWKGVKTSKSTELLKVYQAKYLLAHYSNQALCKAWHWIYSYVPSFICKSVIGFT